MTSSRTKLFAVALMALLLASGGIVGYVVSKRTTTETISKRGPGSERSLERFGRRLQLTDEQAAAVGAIFAETRSSIQKTHASGQAKILELLNDEQKVRYTKMLERQKKRRARRGKKRKKRKERKERRQRDQR